MGAFHLDTVGDQFLVTGLLRGRCKHLTPPDSLTSPRAAPVGQLPPLSLVQGASAGVASLDRGVLGGGLFAGRHCAVCPVWPLPGRGLREFALAGVWTLILRILFSKCFLVKSQNHRHWTFSNHA